MMTQTVKATLMIARVLLKRRLWKLSRDARGKTPTAS